MLISQTCDAFDTSVSLGSRPPNRKPKYPGRAPSLCGRGYFFPIGFDFWFKGITSSEQGGWLSMLNCACLTLACGILPRVLEHSRLPNGHEKPLQCFFQRSCATVTLLKRASIFHYKSRSVLESLSGIWLWLPFSISHSLHKSRTFRPYYSCLLYITTELLAYLCIPLLVEGSAAPTTSVEDTTHKMTGVKTWTSKEIAFIRAALKAKKDVPTIVDEFNVRFPAHDPKHKVTVGSVTYCRNYYTNREEYVHFSDPSPGPGLVWSGPS